MSSKAVIATLAVVAAVAGGVTATLTTWDAYGWITRTAYAQDHEGASVKSQQTAILKALEVIQTGQKDLKAAQDRNQDQWECDETDEELEDLAEKEATGLSAADRRQVTKLNEVWTDLRCSRFTD